jgi:hypothetical protein
MSKIVEWKPTSKQASFLSLPLSINEAFYAGALHAGKTDVLLLYPILHRWHEHPNFKGLFLRRTFPELKNEVIPRSRQFFRAVGGKYNASDKVWTFPSGALFFFGHCENEDDVHNYDSMEPNYAAFDELTSFTEWQYIYISTERVRRPLGSDLPMITRSASNPGNTGHSWVRQRFIDVCTEGNKLIRDRKGNSRIFIPATVYDNPHTDPAYLAKLEALPEAERNAKLLGRWDAFEGSVFTEFRDHKYESEPENAIHVIDSFKIPEWWPKILVGDWGFAAQTWFGWLAISPEKRVYLYREQTWIQTKIESWAPYVKYFIDREHPRVVRLCKSAGQERGQGTIQDQLQKALGVEVELSSNSPGSRVAGKQLLHEYLRWAKKHVPTQDKKEYSPEYAAWMYRNRSVDEYQSYVRSFNPTLNEEVLPKLQIFRDANCDESPRSIPYVVDAIKACVYAKDKEGKPAEDVAEFRGDDPYDGLRYGLSAVEDYFLEAQSEFKKVQETDAIKRQLEEDKDWTAFYRQMEHMEHSNSDMLVARRYH